MWQIIPRNGFLNSNNFLLFQTILNVNRSIENILSKTGNYQNVVYL